MNKKILPTGLALGVLVTALTSFLMFTPDLSAARFGDKAAANVICSRYPEPLRSLCTMMLQHREKLKKAGRFTWNAGKLLTVPGTPDDIGIAAGVCGLIGWGCIEFNSMLILDKYQNCLDGYWDSYRATKKRERNDPGNYLSCAYQHQRGIEQCSEDFPEDDPDGIDLAGYLECIEGPNQELEDCQSRNEEQIPDLGGESLELMDYLTAYCGRQLDRDIRHTNTMCQIDFFECVGESSTPIQNPFGGL